jgi:hypothetical protein
MGHCRSVFAIVFIVGIHAHTEASTLPLTVIAPPIVICPRRVVGKSLILNDINIPRPLGRA